MLIADRPVYTSWIDELDHVRELLDMVAEHELHERLEREDRERDHAPDEFPVVLRARSRAAVGQHSPRSRSVTRAARGANGETLDTDRQEEP